MWSAPERSRGARNSAFRVGHCVAEKEKKRYLCVAMKTLSIRQPWASLIAAGIKDIENRTWDTKFRGKFLIHAAAKKVKKDYEYELPVEIGNEIINHQVFGNIDDLQELPTGAIIGYVELVDIIDNSESVWAFPEQKHWVLKDAHLFETPIENVKGKLGLFDYSLDEDHLPPAYQQELWVPRLEGSTLVLPGTDEDCDDFEGDKEMNSIQFERSSCFEMLFDKEDQLKKVEKIVIEGETKRFEAEVEIEDYPTLYDERDRKPIMAWSQKAGDVEEWKIIYFQMKR